MAKPPRSSRPKSVHRCQQCGHTESKWLGRCPACGEWNTLVEEAVAATGRGSSSIPRSAGAAPVPITEVVELQASTRLSSSIGELDRVLGGGLVGGSLVLLGGDPGVGKSTLLMQLLSGLCRGLGKAGHVLYVSGEESVAQTALRARRLGANDANLELLAETNLERVLSAAEARSPAVLAVDSIQTIYTEAIESIPGAVGQVRECAGRLMAFAKRSGIPTIIVGHVTKDGSIAGPKTLEHLVDAVLHLEGEGGTPYRILRAHKNRFGSTQEIGVFEMRGAGLAEVKNPSELFLAERPVGAPGSIVVASADGVRPLLVEVQALVAPPAAGIARRTAAGFDGNRVALLLAVLAQRADVPVLDRDVFVNVAGGLRLSEPAVDLGVACAIASSSRGRAIDARTVVFGEVGLAGEVRAVSLVDIRLAEAAKLGFRRAILPAQNAKRLERDHGLEIVPIDRLSAALAEL